MQQTTLEKLEWPVLLDHLAAASQTDAGRTACFNLRPDLDRDAIEERWRFVEPLCELAGGGYTAPIGELAILDRLFRAIKMGQTLSGEDLREIFNLLGIVRQVHKFCDDFEERCHTLSLFKARTSPLPELAQTIDQTVDSDGELRDDASPQLSAIRKQKVGLRKRIEHRIRELLTSQDMEKYLQDKFFTIRADRYVVPIKLDGRGRIKGSIYDTSDSGQTLFIEPGEIAPLNEELLEAELSEKLEILRIFRELGKRIEQDIDIITENYAQLVELDVLSAQAILAHQYEGRAIEISDEPQVALHAARHPLVKTPDGAQAIPNNIGLDAAQRVLIVSGPNAGGKTVVLKTVGMIHLMAKAGLLVPAAAESTIHLFDEIFIELGDAQSLEANLSTFSGHILGLKPIVESTNARSLVLLDEIAVGTEPQAGSAIAQAILEELAAKDSKTIVTTHFDALKSLAVEDKRFRNGSMEYATDSYQPTYRLILDVPGQSYGIEVAEQMGLPAHIVARARSLRGTEASTLDQIVSELMASREQVRERESELERKVLEAETQKSHWESERENLHTARSEAAEQLTDTFERKIRDLQVDFLQTIDSLKQQIRNLEKAQRVDSKDKQAFDKAKKAGEKSVQELNLTLKELQEETAPKELPGDPAQFENLQVGDRIYMVSLQQEGKIAKLGSNRNQPIEIQAGSLSMWLPVTDLRVLRDHDAAPAPGRKTKGMVNHRKAPEQTKEQEIGLTIQSLTNSIDLRGMTIEEALGASWKFIDQALMRGELRVILIHGHGENKIKAAMRAALKKDCPYQVRFRAGEPEEGGDGVTILALD